MKKISKNMTIIAMVSFILIALICVAMKGCYNDTHYKTCAYVDSVTDQEILIVTPDGNVWSIDYEPNIYENQIVELLFYNGGTDNTMKDDVIINVKII